MREMRNDYGPVSETSSDEQLRAAITRHAQRREERATPEQLAILSNRPTLTTVFQRNERRGTPEFRRAAMGATTPTPERRKPSMFSFGGRRGRRRPSVFEALMPRYVADGKMPHANVSLMDAPAPTPSARIARRRAQDRRNAQANALLLQPRAVETRPTYVMRQQVESELRAQAEQAAKPALNEGETLTTTVDRKTGRIGLGIYGIDKQNAAHARRITRNRDSVLLQQRRAQDMERVAAELKKRKELEEMHKPGFVPKPA